MYNRGSYRKVDDDANFQPTKTHLNNLLFIFPPTSVLEMFQHVLENVVTFFNENVEPTFFNQHFSEKSCINIF
jgi:hypothetical protein